MTKSAVQSMTKKQRELLRAAMSRMGKAGSRADKQKAGRLGVLARVRNMEAKAAAAANGK
jgi:hypothetical protein